MPLFDRFRSRLGQTPDQVRAWVAPRPIHTRTAVASKPPRQMSDVICWGLRGAPAQGGQKRPRGCPSAHVAVSWITRDTMIDRPATSTMGDTSIADLLQRNAVRSWLETAENIYPGFQTDLVCLGGPRDGRITQMHRKAVSRVLVSFAASTFSRLKLAPKLTYARLRDWEVHRPCELLETWARSNITVTNVELALGNAEEPATILNDGSVLDWLADSSAVNDAFCKQVRFAILQRGAGDPPAEAQIQALQVSLPGWSTVLCFLMLVSDGVHNRGEEAGQWVREGRRFLRMQDGLGGQIRNAGGEHSGSGGQGKEAEGGAHG